MAKTPIPPIYGEGAGLMGGVNLAPYADDAVLAAGRFVKQNGQQPEENIGIAGGVGARPMIGAPVNRFAAADRFIETSNYLLEKPHSWTMKFFAPLWIASGAIDWIGKKIGTTNKVGSTLKRTGELVYAPTGFVTGNSWKEMADKVGMGGLVPNRIADQSFGHSIWQASFVGLDALQMFGTARTFAEHLESLRQMAADMTGKKVSEISNTKLLFGKLPAPVAAARTELLANTGIKGVIQTASLALNLAFLRGKEINMWKAMGIQAGISFGGDALAGMIGEAAILPVYKAFSDAHMRGEHIPPDARAAFLVKANHDLSSRGRVGEAFARELVKRHYGAASPADMMKDIANGHMKAHIKEIKQEYDAQMAQYKAKIVKNHSVSNANAPGQHTGKGSSHVDRLARKHEKVRPSVGMHTDGLNRQDAVRAQSQGYGPEVN